MNIYLGASGAINPLGNSVSAIHSEMRKGNSGITLYANAFNLGKDEYLGIISEELLPQGPEDKIYRMLRSVIAQTQQGLNKVETIQSERTRLILCSTKGNIPKLEEGDTEEIGLSRLAEYVHHNLKIKTQPMVISSACVSGLLGIINGARMIQQGLADNVLVMGVDLVSRFTLSGFISFYATASSVCKPYDKNRDGINLGEAAASVILTNDPRTINTVEGEFLGGASANDANHISGPSRTGEGLCRSVRAAMMNAGVSNTDISYISAHGTATSFNDEMESIAFDRLKLNETPLNSFKGYFGHTLGAAGLIESLIGMQSLNSDCLPKSYGYESSGTSKNINVLTENLNGDFKIMLKTSSGFGGANAAGVFKKL